MDGHRFDSIVRSLGTSPNRRQLLKGILGLSGAALGASRLEAEAARRGSSGPKLPSTICPAYPMTCYQAGQPFEYGCLPTCWVSGACEVCPDIQAACCEGYIGECEVFYPQEACVP